MFQFDICFAFAIGRTFTSCRKYKEIKNILSCFKGSQKNNMIMRLVESGIGNMCLTSLALVTTKRNSLLLAKAKKRKGVK